MTESDSSIDAQWMMQALELAKRGLNSTSPNPRVGCVLVQGNQVVGQGWHERAGQDHAEVIAIAKAGAKAEGATAYVTLEPCNHHGRTPPCTKALMDAKIARVVVAIEDPDPRTAGQGLVALQQAGIEVEVGVCSDLATELNIGFIQRHRMNKPWVRMKLAASLDGRSSAPDGRSQWITSAEARADGHCWRARACVVLTGIDTVSADDPILSARPQGLRDPLLQPIRMVLDSHARMPEHAKILDGEAPLWIVSTMPQPAWFSTKQSCDVQTPAQWHQLRPDGQGRVDLQALMDLLVAHEINEVHVEAGPTLSGALIEQGMVDEVVLYQAPVLLGSGRPVASLSQLETFDQRIFLSLLEATQMGPDQRLIFRGLKPCSATATGKQ